MALCIPQSVKDKLRTAFSVKDISIEKLYDMRDEERRTVFSNYVGDKLSQLVNAEFEKAKIEAQKRAAADYISVSQKGAFTKQATLGEFGKKLLNPEEIKRNAVIKIDEQIKKVQERQKAVSDDISNLKGENKANAQFKLNKLQDQEAQLNVRRENTLNPQTDALLKKIQGMKTLLGDSDYHDLVSVKMGVGISDAEGKYITAQAEKLQELSKNMKDTPFGMTPEYIVAKNSLNSFIDNLAPSSPLAIIRSSINIARNFLLTGLAIPIKITANLTTVPGSMLIRRIAELSLRGDNYDLVKQFKNEDAADTAKSGTSVSQLRDKNDVGTVLGSHKGAEGFNASKEGAIGAVQKGVGKVEQISHYIAITLEHTKLFNFAYRSTFYDTLNFRASGMARQEGMTGDAVKTRAAEIIKDAVKVEPQTDAGKFLRADAQATAAHTTNTNDSYASRFSLGVKNMLNSVHPDIPLGNLIEPMAKIPSNVISNSIKLTPAGIPSALWDIVRGRYNLQADNSIETQYQGLSQYKNGVESAIAIVGSMGIAALITRNLTQKDFREDNYGNYYVKFGDVWVNTEYFSRISPNIAGMMANKMNPKQNILQGYLQATAQGLKKLPGINEPIQAVNAALGKHPVQSLVSAVESRAPAILLNLSKTRPLNRVFFGAHGIETTEQVKQDAIERAKLRKK